MTLRARLLFALLAMAIIPIVAFTMFTLDQLDRSAQRWVRPGVERSLGSALEVSRSSLAHLDGTVLACAAALAPFGADGALNATERTEVQEELGESRLDFAQLYRRDGTGWKLVEQVAPPGVLAPSTPDLGAEVAAAIDSSAQLVHSKRGVLAGVARASEHAAIVAGIWVPPDFFERVEDVGEGVAHYRQLGVLVSLQRRWVWLVVSALTIGLVVLALVFANALARSMSRPLSELSGAIERVAAGELGTRVQPTGARELQTLATSFNAMTARIEAARVSLQHAEREAAWRDVARHLAHEIKNPLTAMRYALHRIQRRVDLIPAGDREAVAQSVDAILREVQDLALMAEQFSQYARKPEPRLEELDLAVVVRDAAALEEPEAVRVTGASDGLGVRGDRVLLSRAVQNLMVNAREAGGAGAVVEMKLGREPDRAVLEVLDRGPGLPEGSSERLFEPYVSTKNRGSGLGLSLVRDVAQQHGGGITLANREGGGAVARLWLPLMTDTKEVQG